MGTVLSANPDLSLVLYPDLSPIRYITIIIWGQVRVCLQGQVWVCAQNRPRFLVRHRVPGPLLFKRDTCRLFRSRQKYPRQIL